MKSYALLFIIAFLLPQTTFAFDEEDGFLLDYVPEPTHYCNPNGSGASIYILDDFTSEGHAFPFLTYGWGNQGWGNIAYRFRLDVYEGTEMVILDGEEVRDYFYGFVYLGGSDFNIRPDLSFFKEGAVLAGRFVIKTEDAYCRLIETIETGEN